MSFNTSVVQAVHHHCSPLPDYSATYINITLGHCHDKDVVYGSGRFETVGDGGLLTWWLTGAPGRTSCTDTRDRVAHTTPGQHSPGQRGPNAQLSPYATRRLTQT